MNQANSAILGNKDDSRLDWGQFQFLCLLKVQDARSEDDLNRYYSLVQSLEITLSGHKDDEYQTGYAILKRRKAAFEQDHNEYEVDNFYYDELMRLLSELLYRVNRGVPRVRETLEYSGMIDEIIKRLADGIGQNVAMTGSPGSGKSHSSIKIAEIISERTGIKFDPEKHVVFNPYEFSKVYNDQNTTPPGSIIIYDEAGVTSNSKDHYKEGNKNMAKLFQTIRHRAVLVIMTAPDLGMIEKDLRKLLHYWLSTEELQKARGICVIKPAVVQVVQRDGKILYPFPVFDGKKVTRIEVSRISAHSETVYERKAKQYKDDLAMRTEMTLSLVTDQKVERLKKFAEMRRSGMKIKQACEELGVTTNTGTRLEAQRRKLKM